MIGAAGIACDRGLISRNSIAPEFGFAAGKYSAWRMEETPRGFQPAWSSDWFFPEGSGDDYTLLTPQLVLTPTLRHFTSGQRASTAGGGVMTGWHSTCSSVIVILAVPFLGMCPYCTMSLVATVRKETTILATLTDDAVSRPSRTYKYSAPPSRGESKSAA